MSAELKDDPSVSDATHLWRRIPHWHWVQLAEGGWRPSSAGFDDDPDGDPMSVFVAEESTPEHVLAGHERFAIAAVGTGFVRHDCGQRVVRKLDNGYPSHCLVVGPK